KTGSHEEQHDRILAGASAQLLEFIKLAVEVENGTRQRVIGEMPEEITANAAQGRRQGRDDGVAIGALGARQRHGQEKDVGRYEEDPAFNKNDHGDATLRRAAEQT